LLTDYDTLKYHI